MAEFMPISCYGEAFKCLPQLLLPIQARLAVVAKHSGTTPCLLEIVDPLSSCIAIKASLVGSSLLCMLD